MYSDCMGLRVIEERREALPEFGKMPIVFEVRSRLRIEPVRRGLGGLSFVELCVSPLLRCEYPGEWLWTTPRSRLIRELIKLGQEYARYVSWQIIPLGAH